MDIYDTISDVRRGPAVQMPEIREDDNFVLLKLDGEGGVGVTLYNITPEEALDALMGTVMAING